MMDAIVDEISKIVMDSGRASSINALYIGGSRAYGLDDESSDIDIRGFFTPSARDIAAQNVKEQFDIKNPDVVLYSLKKFVSLLGQCNPNMIECLGLDDDMVLIDSDAFRQLREHQDKILSRHVIKSFGGYATGMMKRIENGSFSDVRHHAKACSHYIRLMNMGTEILSGEGVRTRRTEDRKILMEAKRGEYTVVTENGKLEATDEFYNMSNELEAKFKEATLKTSLPAEADTRWLEDLVVSENIYAVKNEYSYL